MIHLELDLAETDANFLVSYLVIELHAYMNMDKARVLQQQVTETVQQQKIKPKRGRPTK